MAWIPLSSSRLQGEAVHFWIAVDGDGERGQGVAVGARDEDGDLAAALREEKRCGRHQRAVQPTRYLLRFFVRKSGVEMTLVTLPRSRL